MEGKPNIDTLEMSLTEFLRKAEIERFQVEEWAAAGILTIVKPGTGNPRRYGFRNLVEVKLAKYLLRAFRVGEVARIVGAIHKAMRAAHVHFDDELIASYDFERTVVIVYFSEHHTTMIERKHKPVVYVPSAGFKRLQDLGRDFTLNPTTGAFLINLRDLATDALKQL